MYPNPKPYTWSIYCSSCELEVIERPVVLQKRHTLRIRILVGDKHPAHHCLYNGDVQMIPHYHAEGIPMSKLCEIHGWTARETPRRVFDAVIFSNEIDLLEIRMRVRNSRSLKFIVIRYLE